MDQIAFAVAGFGLAFGVISFVRLQILVKKLKASGALAEDFDF